MSMSPSPKGYRFIAAYGPWRWFLEGQGYRGITMPWRSIYLLRQHFDCEELRYHEVIHIEQMDRDGTLRFCVMYLVYLVRYGYWNNPYELEAYDRTRRAFADADNGQSQV